MNQKLTKSYYFTKLRFCSLSKLQKTGFALKVPQTILLFGLLICIYSPSVAQNQVLPSSDNSIRINGTVSDAKGQKLSDVSVTIKGTSTGTVTDLTGKYSISAKIDDTLAFTYVSYVTQEVRVINQTIINVKLSESSTALNDVVVVGYGTQKKMDLTGSIASISEAEIKKVPIASIGQALQGRAAGVQVIQTSQKPGGGVSVRIRGGNSLQGGNEPLYVIDGFPIYNESGPSINPNDIASIEILKDASATSIYGSRGANGVVLITTKKGRAGKTSINFETYYGIQRVRKFLPLLNAKEYAILFNEAYINDGKPAVYRQSFIDSLGEGTDWQKEIFRSAPMQNYQLSFAGGSDKTQYSISANYFSQAGVIINSDFKRASFRINLDTKVTDRFKLGTNLAFTRSIEKGVLTDVEGGRNGSVVNAALVMNPILPVYKEDGSYILENDAGTIVGNPVASAKEIKNNNINLRLLGNVFGEYAFSKSLTGRVSLGANINSSELDYYASRNTVLGASQNGVGSISSSRNEQWLNENTLTYNKELNDKNKLNVLLGFTMQGAKNRNTSASSQNFTNDILQENNLGSASQANFPTSGANSWGLLSYLSRVNYNFSDKYLFTATARVDGSSRFGEGNKYGFFPSAAFAWRISEEKFLQNAKILSDLKLRASYGITGSQEIPQYQSLAALNSNGYIFNNTRVVGYSISRFANPNLKWETTGQFDVGFDIGFLRNRITVTTDLYYKKTKDLLLEVTLPWTSGFVQTLENLGQVENKGIELGINSENIKGNFGWNTNFNISANRNKVVNLGNIRQFFPPDVISSQLKVTNMGIVQVGQPLGQFYGLLSNGIFQSQAEVEVSAQKAARPGERRYVDLNQDGVINGDDRTVIGNAQPKFLGGLTNTFSYRGVELSIFLQGVFGNEILNINRFELDNINGFTNTSKNSLNRWTPTNPSTSIARASQLRAAYDLSNIQVEDGSYLRAKSISLAYNLPETISNRARLKAARFYVSAINLFTITNYSGYDPEVSRFGQNNLLQGADYGSYPGMKSFIVGLNLSL